MNKSASVICWGCDHYHENNDDELEGYCRAFPGEEEGPPREIEDLHSHDKPYEGGEWDEPQDNDYVYTPVKKSFRHFDKITIYQDSNPYADENGRYNGK